MSHAEYTGKPEGYKRFLRVLKEEFPGPNNEGIRRKIRKMAGKGSILGLLKTIAFQEWGKNGLKRVDAALADWDGRAAQQDQEDRVFLGRENRSW